MKPIAGALAAIVLCLLLGGGCAGSSCRSAGQCAGGLSCVGPNEGPSCGIAPRRECAASTDCQGGQVCHAMYDPCSPSFVGSHCGAPCGACDPGFRCNAAGACEPLPCDQGYACPTHQRCDVTAAHAGGPVYGRTQGCVNIDCASDGDCPAGACVNGYCQDGPGSCMKVLAVP